MFSKSKLLLLREKFKAKAGAFRQAGDIKQAETWEEAEQAAAELIQKLEKRGARMGSSNSPEHFRKMVVAAGHRNFTAEDDAVVMEGIKDGLSSRAIARKIGRQSSAVLRRIDILEKAKAGAGQHAVKED